MTDIIAGERTKKKTDIMHLLSHYVPYLRENLSMGATVNYFSSTSKSAEGHGEGDGIRCGWQEIALFSDTGNVITLEDCYPIGERRRVDGVL